MWSFNPLNVGDNNLRKGYEMIHWEEVTSSLTAHTINKLLLPCEVRVSQALYFIMVVLLSIGPTSIVNNNFKKSFSKPANDMASFCK